MEIEIGIGIGRRIVGRVIELIESKLGGGKIDVS